MTTQIPHSSRQFLRCPPVVAVEEGNNLAARFRNSKIERRSLATIRFAQQAHPTLELANDFWRTIGRAIVNHQDFRIIRRKILFQHTHERFLDEALVVVSIDQDCSPRLYHWDLCLMTSSHFSLGTAR